jgi:mRNA interferase RelE/StbE
LYQIKFLKEAINDLKRIDPIWQKRIVNKIKILGEAPELLKNNIKKLKGEHSPFYRLRVGTYRIIYSIENNEMFILIIRIGHRSSVY